jgi:hypothetical protein
MGFFYKGSEPSGYALTLKPTAITSIALAVRAGEDESVTVQIHCE